MKVLFAVLILCCVACGSGGGSTPITLPESKLIGTYHLKSFEIFLASGFSVNETDFPHWSGTMKVSENTITSMYNLDGDISEDAQLYAVAFDDATHKSGTITLSNGDQVLFGCNGYDVEISYQSFDPTFGNYYEVDVWRKVGN